MALGATAALFVRNPAVFAIAAFAMLPLRLPVQVGDETNFLLVPLYGVIAGGWLRAVWLLGRGRGEELQTASSPRAGDSPAARWLCIALAASLVAYAVAIAWSNDPRNAIVTVAFFLTPFAALFVLLRDLRWYRKLVGQVFAAFVAVCAVFAGLALWQYGDSRPVAEPRAAGRQPAASLFPGELRVPRPQRAGPLPGAGDRRARAPGSPGAGRGPRRSAASRSPRS